MADRRSLVEGLKPASLPVGPNREKQFVFADKSPPIETSMAQPIAAIPRSPLSTRIRSDFATALKRASLERQLKGVEPNALCDILEAAIEPWLKSHGDSN